MPTAKTTMLPATTPHIGLAISAIRRRTAGDTTEAFTLGLSVEVSGVAPHLLQTWRKEPEIGWLGDFSWQEEAAYIV